jgi:hypothetical protein
MKFIEAMFLGRNNFVSLEMLIGKKLSRNRPWSPTELCDVTDPNCLDNRLTDGGKVVCQPYAPAALYSPETLLFFMFLVLISVRGGVNPRA